MNNLIMQLKVCFIFKQFTFQLWKFSSFHHIFNSCIFFKNSFNSFSINLLENEYEIIFHWFKSPFLYKNISNTWKFLINVNVYLHMSTFRMLLYKIFGDLISWFQSQNDRLFVRCVIFFVFIYSILHLELLDSSYLFK